MTGSNLRTSLIFIVTALALACGDPRKHGIDNERTGMPSAEGGRTGTGGTGGRGGAGAGGEAGGPGTAGTGGAAADPSTGGKDGGSGTFDSQPTIPTDAAAADGPANGLPDSGPPPDGPGVPAPDAPVAIDSPAAPPAPPCSGTCAANARRCQGDRLEQCTMVDGCLTWTLMMNCPAPANATATCQQNTCSFRCNGGFNKCGDQCRENSVDSCGNSCTRCPTPANGVASCNGGSCQFTCNPGFERNGNQCRSCVSCPEGQRRCQGGNTVQECVRMGSCTDWRTTQTCSSARSCSRSGTSCECKESSCAPGCASSNTERTCTVQDGCPVAQESRCQDPRTCSGATCTCPSIGRPHFCSPDGRAIQRTGVRNGCEVIEREECPGRKVCREGACVCPDGSCTPGEKRCSAADPKVVETCADQGGCGAFGGFRCQDRVDEATGVRREGFCVQEGNDARCVLRSCSKQKVNPFSRDLSRLSLRTRLTDCATRPRRPYRNVIGPRVPAAARLRIREADRVRRRLSRLPGRHGTDTMADPRSNKTGLGKHGDGA